MKYPLNGIVERVKFAREAANVERCHTTPGIGSYSVGIHSFNMLTMLLILNPEASGNLIRAVVEHDLAERITGDMPHHAKKGGIQIRTGQIQTEHNVNSELFGINSYRDLSHDDASWLHGLDMLEFYCWVRDQMKLGNQTVIPKATYVHEFMIVMKSHFPKPIVDLYYEIANSTWDTLPDGRD